MMDYFILCRSSE